jgi:hypothetical protein
MDKTIPTSNDCAGTCIGRTWFIDFGDCRR